MKNLKSALFLLLISLSSFSQEEEESEKYEHILGLEIRTGSSDFGFAYRRVYSKMNFKLGAYLGSDSRSNVSSNYLFPTQNTATPFLLINRHFSNERNSQSIEIGAEYLVKKKKYLSTYLGLDLVLEHRAVKQYGSVLKTNSLTVAKNGSNYYEFSTGDQEAFIPERNYDNLLESKYNYFGIGGNLRYLVMYEVNPYFIVSAELGVSYFHRILYNSTYSYSSEEYNTHLPELPAESTPNFDFLTTSFGVHYIF